MKQVLRKGIKDIVVDDVPDPTVKAHHVLIRPVYSLISSGTETASIHQQGVVREVADNPSHLRKIWDVMTVTNPMATLREVRAKFGEYAALGYSGAGVVVDKHPTVAGLEIGSRVAYGGEGTGHAETVITGRHLTARVPDTVPFEHACFATLGSIAMNTVRVANVGLGEHVVVLGLGLVGQLVAQLARLQGGSVIAADLKDERVRLAETLGARGLPAGPSLPEAVLANTGGAGADCVIVAAASKSSGPCHAAVSMCRDRGRIVVVGAVDLAFPWQQMYLKEIQMFMARAYGPGSYDPQYEQLGRDYPLPFVRWTENRNMEEVLRLIAAGALKVDPLITHRFELDDAPAAYQTILEPGSSSLAVLLRYPAAASPDPLRDYTPSHKTAIPGPRPADGLRFALVGSGNIARWWHLPALKKIPGAAIRAICSSSGVRGKSYGIRFGAEYCCSRYEEILEDARIDAVLITSRNQHHASQTVAALKAGKHVFVEKPMALTEDECRDIVSAAAESGKRVAVGFNRRFAPFYLEFKRHVCKRSGPVVLNCRVNSPGISSSYWMADPAIGGAILGEACHFVDLMYWLLDSEPVAVCAFSLPRGSKEPIGENNTCATFRFEDGSVANLTYCTVGSKTSGGERLEFFGPGIGAYTADFKRLSVRTGVRRNRSKWWAEKGYDAQLASFAEALRTGAEPKVTLADGVRATVACLRMLDSARLLEPRHIRFHELLDPKA